MQTLWDKLVETYSPTKNGRGMPVIELGNMEIFNTWTPWFDDVEPLIDDAEIIEGYPFVKLEKVIEWKTSFGREKDLKDLKLIEEYLKH